MSSMTWVKRTSLTTGALALGASAQANHYECEWRVSAQVYAADSQDPAELSVHGYRGVVPCEVTAEVGVANGGRPPGEPAGSASERRKKRRAGRANRHRCRAKTTGKATK